MADKDVLIYLRRITLDVVIPKAHVWDFILGFGESFAIDNYEGGRELRKIDSYTDHPNGWHVQVSLLTTEEGRFYAFLQQFCLTRNISFRDPRGKSTPQVL